MRRRNPLHQFITQLNVKENQMRMTTPSTEARRLDFVASAAAAFKANPNLATFGKVKEGEYLALRWGMGNDCIVVVQIDENVEPVNYQNVI